MLYVTKDTVIPTVEQARQVLQRNTDDFGMPVDYDRMCEYYSKYMIDAARLLKPLAEVLKYSDDPLTITDAVVLNWIKEVSGHYIGFNRTPKGAISMDERSILNAIECNKHDENVCSVLQIYLKIRSLRNAVSMFKKILMTAPISKSQTWDNHRLIMLHPVWVEQNTGRLGFTSPGLMNIKRELKDIFTVPKGWRYLCCDSSQIEPRLNFSWILRDEQIFTLINLYNDAYYGLLHYCTMPEEDIRSKRLDFTPFEITDELKAKRQEFKTESNAVSYGATSNRDNSEIRDAYISRIGEHPLRRKMQEKVEAAILQGRRTFNTYFGNPIDITKGPSENEYPDKSSEEYFTHLTRCAINNPIQGTAADLLRLSICEADKLMQKKAPYSFIIRSHHDSNAFAIHESDVDKVYDTLSDITAYQIEGFIPIGAGQEELKTNENFPRLIV